MLAKMEATPSVLLALTLLDFADESDIFTLEANNRKRRMGPRVDTGEGR
jgi:hypothetical protein